MFIITQFIISLFAGTTLSLRLNHHVSEAQHQMEALQLSAQLNQLQSDSKQKVRGRISAVVYRGGHISGAGADTEI